MLMQYTPRNQHLPSCRKQRRPRILERPLLLGGQGHLLIRVTFTLPAYHLSDGVGRLGPCEQSVLEAPLQIYDASSSSGAVSPSGLIPGSQAVANPVMPCCHVGLSLITEKSSIGERGILRVLLQITCAGAHAAEYDCD